MGSLAQLFKDCADKIRSKTGSTAQIIANNLPNAIDTLQYGSSLTVYRSDDPKEIPNYFMQQSGLNISNVRTINIVSAITRIGSFAFDYNNKLESINLPSSLTYIGAYAFRNCKSLPLTSLPSGVNYLGGAAFQECDKLALTTLPPGITTIYTYAFYYCPKLALTALPPAATTIGAQAFYLCTGLKQLTMGGPGSPMISIAASAFAGCTNLTNITVYTADGQIPAGAPWGAPNATITAIKAA